MTTEPIFIHSLFRSASTYFFQKFRSLGDGYTCYQEPFNESLAVLNDPEQHDRLLESPVGSPLRHPPLDKPYFFEFWARRRQLGNLFSAAFAYQQYFLENPGHLPPSQLAYVAALLEHAQGRPVLQFCRSSGRAGQLRREFAGVHLHLWREPRVQWWSYKVSDYFDNATQHIYRAAYLPEALQRIAALARLSSTRNHHLRPRDNYLIFYGLWLDAWLQLRSHVDLSINVDGITVSRAENIECARQLGELIEQPLDLSDVRASGMQFTVEEQAFYEDVESTVNALFIQTRRGTSRSIEAAYDAARRARRAHETLTHDAAAERNVRQAALKMMERLAVQEHTNQRAWTVRLNPLRMLEYRRSARQPEPGALDLQPSHRTK